MSEIERIFGDRVLEKYGNAVLNDAKAQLAAGRYLRAALAASLGVYLAGKRPWSDGEQGAMVDALWEEAQRRLDAGDYLTAAARSGYVGMLDAGRHWRADFVTRMREATQPRLERGQSWRRAHVAGMAGDYLRLGGEATWDAEALRQMLAALADDFHVYVKRNDALMAADRLALYSLLSSVGPVATHGPGGIAVSFFPQD